VPSPEKLGHDPGDDRQEKPGNREMPDELINCGLIIFMVDFTAEKGKIASKISERIAGSYNTSGTEPSGRGV
jgi:hypothetical protein